MFSIPHGKTSLMRFSNLQVPQFGWIATVFLAKTLSNTPTKTRVFTCSRTPMKLVDTIERISSFLSGNCVLPLNDQFVCVCVCKTSCPKCFFKTFPALEDRYFQSLPIISSTIENPHSNKSHLQLQRSSPCLFQHHLMYFLALQNATQATLAL